MNILKQPDKDILKVLRRQKADDKEYRRALWLVEDGNLIHNTLTGEVIELEGNESDEELISRRYLVSAQW